MGILMMGETYPGLCMWMPKSTQYYNRSVRCKNSNKGCPDVKCLKQCLKISLHFVHSIGQYYCHHIYRTTVFRIYNILPFQLSFAANIHEEVWGLKGKIFWKLTYLSKKGCNKYLIFKYFFVFKMGRDSKLCNYLTHNEDNPFFTN